MGTNVYNILHRICKTKYNENLKKYCSIKIGGNAKAVCFPNSIRKLKKLILVLKKFNIKYNFVGCGTNLVFDDKFYDGVIINLTKLNKIKKNKNCVVAQAGANLFVINYFCKKNNLGGFEWSYGIPGSIGGAVVMNAGCYGKEIKDVVKQVFYLKNGKVSKFSNNQCGFSYRHSIFKNTKYVILKVILSLKQLEESVIDFKQKEILNKRLQSQPYETLNCGSVFKKIGQESAGKVIDKLGLKGVKIGDIEISSKHANFFINNGNASFEDFEKLISFVKNEVLKKEGKVLTEEVIFVRS